MKLRKMLKKVIPVIDKKLSVLSQDEIDKLLFRGVIYWIEDISMEVLSKYDEDVTDYVLTYMQIKYGKKHPLRGFLK
jgi:hypothetical protein